MLPKKIRTILKKRREKKSLKQCEKILIDFENSVKYLQNASNEFELNYSNLKNNVLKQNDIKNTESFTNEFQ